MMTDLEFTEWLVDRDRRFWASTVPREGMLSYFPTKRWPGASAVWFEPMPRGGTDETVCNPLKEQLLMWRRVMDYPYCKGPKVPILTRKDLGQVQLPNVNTDWDEILKCLNHVGRPGGEGEFLRPKGQWIHDLVKDPDGYTILEAAHAIAHLRAMVAGEKGVDRIKTGFLECLVELTIALKYGLTIWVPTPEQISGELDPAKREQSWFEMHGVKIAVSVNMRKPWLITPAIDLLAYRASVVVLAGVHLEPQPWSAREDNPNEKDESWLEMNRWSCMPSLISLSGWKAIDELMKAPLVLPYRNSGKEDVCVAMPVTALDPMSVFDKLVDGTRRTDMDSFDGIVPAEWLLDTEYVRRLTRCIPPFPCKDCLRLNNMASGAPTRPALKRPSVKDRMYRRKGDKMDEADKEWEAYDAKVDKIIKVVDKACEFHDVRFGFGLKARKERKRNAKKAAELLDRISKEEDLIEGLNKKMEYSRASHERLLLYDYRTELANMLKGEGQ